MTTKIQLDLQGLNALFPLGSEARADLSRAVTHSLIQRLAASDTQRLSDAHKAEVRAITSQTLIAMGIGIGTYSVNLDPRVRTAIESAAKEAVASQIQEAVKQQLADLPERVATVFAGMAWDSTRPIARDWVQQTVRAELANIKVSVS